MKKILFSFATFLVGAMTLQAQPFLFGMTSRGGAYDKGVIFSYDPGSNAYYKLKDFLGGPDGAVPYSSMCLASNGLLYGMTTEGGATDQPLGVLFSFNPATNTYTKLKDFTELNGGRPESGSLMQASNGLLYGVTAHAIFSFDPLTNTYTKLHDQFLSRSGGLIQASDGLLYGTTLGAGNGRAVIFSFDPVTNTYSEKHNISVGSFGRLAEADNGLLYGLNASGTIFSYNRSTNVYVEIVSAGTDAFGGLIRASNGVLYGMTKGLHTKGISIPGTFFSFDPATNVYSTLKEFNGEPLGTPMQASDGLIYAMVPNGGSMFGGFIFSFNPMTNTYTELRNFTPRYEGAEPWWNAALTEAIIKPACAPPTFLDNNTIVLDASCGGNDGNISIIPQSGKAPYQYSIDGGASYVEGAATGYTFQNLAAGTYQLRLKDANGCESRIITRQVRNVYGTPTFLNNGTIVLDASCSGNDGNISIIPTCGTLPFQYSIDGGVTYVQGPDAGYTFENLSAGSYQLRLKDAAGHESGIVIREVKANAYGPCATIINPRLHSTKDTETSDVLAYPNPSRGQFQVQLLGFEEQRVQVLLMNAQGVVVEQRRINVSGGYTLNFDLSGKAKGLYLIKIVGNGGVQQTKVLIQ